MAKSRKRRAFTPEQRAQFARVYNESDKTLAQLAEDLGVSVSALGRWVRESGTGQRSTQQAIKQHDESDELARLRKENRQLRAERDVLKKSIAVFARENA